MMIEEREYARLLGYPWGTLLEGDVRGRAAEAAAWYERYGKPRVLLRRTTGRDSNGNHRRRRSRREVAKLWKADRVDEAYSSIATLPLSWKNWRPTLGPIKAPGQGRFHLKRQWTLFSYIQHLNPEIEMLPSGMLNPKNSLLAIVPFDAETTPNPCTRCDLPGCTFRRKSA